MKLVCESLMMPGVHGAWEIVWRAMSAILNLPHVRAGIAQHGCEATQATQEPESPALVYNKHASVSRVLPGPGRVGNVRWHGRECRIRCGAKQTRLLSGWRTQPGQTRISAVRLGTGCDETLGLDVSPDLVWENGMTTDRASGIEIFTRILRLNVATVRTLAIMTRGHEVPRIFTDSVGFPHAPVCNDL